MDMSVAVIGSNGFIGRGVVPALRAAGAHVVEFPSQKAFLRPDGSPTDELAAAGSVCYLASRITPAIAERDPQAVAAHLATVQSLLDALRDSGKRVVYPSSGGTVYDADRAPPYAETSPLKAIGRFGATKIQVEEMLREAPGIETVALRVSNAYGPGQTAGRGFGVIAHWIAAAARQEPVHVFGSLETTRDFVYIDDVCTAFALVLASEAPPQVVNVGSGVPTTLGELLDVIGDVTGEVDVVLEPDRGFDLARSWLDVTRAKETLGWEPQVDLAEGIARTWEHARRVAPARRAIG
jgi:UDP-glucose 4-epimerase